MIFCPGVFFYRYSAAVTRWLVKSVCVCVKKKKRHPAPQTLVQNLLFWINVSSDWAVASECQTKWAVRIMLYRRTCNLPQNKQGTVLDKLINDGLNNRKPDWIFHNKGNCTSPPAPPSKYIISIFVKRNGCQIMHVKDESGWIIMNIWIYCGFCCK